VDRSLGLVEPPGPKREPAEAETEGTEYRCRRSPTDRPAVAVKSCCLEVGVEPRGRLIRNVESITGHAREKRGNMPTSQVKPFDIPRRWCGAYRRVAANRVPRGVDEETLGEFESDLKNNLYRIWNR